MHAVGKDLYDELGRYDAQGLQFLSLVFWRLQPSKKASAGRETGIRRVRCIREQKHANWIIVQPTARSPDRMRWT